MARAITDKIQQQLEAGGRRRWARKRVLTLRAEDVQPVVRIAHRSGPLEVRDRIIFDHELVLVLHGRGEATVGGERFSWSARDLLFIRPFVPHALTAAAGPGAHLAIHFDFAPGVPAHQNNPDRRRPYEVQLARGVVLPSRVHLPAGHRILHAFEEVIREWSHASAAGDPLGGWAVRSLMSRILLYVAREAGRDPAGGASDGRTAANIERLDRAAAFVRDTLPSPVSPDAMAAAAGMSASRFNVLFARHTGYSPAEFARILRVERARSLLADPDLSIKEVARLAGFVDAYHFSKVFRRIDGLSPSEYRAGAVRHPERAQLK